jgi:hypothetical protein
MKVRTVALTLVVLAALAGAQALRGAAAAPPDYGMDDDQDQPAARISKDQITAMLLASGYTMVHNVKMTDGVWKAEAVDASGDGVEITLDPNDGHIIDTGAPESD